MRRVDCSTKMEAIKSHLAYDFTLCGHLVVGACEDGVHSSATLSPQRPTGAGDDECLRISCSCLSVGSTLTSSMIDQTGKGDSYLIFF